MQNFISFVASIAELARGEKMHTQSLTHSPGSFDAPRTEAFASEYQIQAHQLKYISQTKSQSRSQIMD